MLINTALKYTFTFRHSDCDDNPFDARTCEMSIIEENKRTSVFTLSLSSDKSHTNTYVLCCYAGDCWITSSSDEICVFLKDPMNVDRCMDDLVDFELEDDQLEELGTAVKTAAHHCWAVTYPDEMFIRNFIYVPQEDEFQ